MLQIKVTSIDLNSMKVYIIHAVFHFLLLGERSLFLALCDVGIITDRYV
jgi:hypothetical protein